MDFYNYFGLSCSVKSLNFYCYEFNRSIYYVATVMFPFIMVYCYWRAKWDFINVNNVKLKKVLLYFLGMIFIFFILMVVSPYLPVEIRSSPSASDLSGLNTHKDPVTFILRIYIGLFLVSIFSGIGLKFLVFYIRSFKNDMSCK